MDGRIHLRVYSFFCCLLVCLLLLTKRIKSWKMDQCKWCHKTFQGNRWDKIDCIVMQYSLAYFFIGGRKAKSMSRFKKEIYTRFWKFIWQTWSHREKMWAEKSPGEAISKNVINTVDFHYQLISRPILS